jgi:glutamate-1-semialdehyde 2,1-aminomutase
MKQPRDYSELVRQLAREFALHSPRSAALNVRALQTMVDGGSHPLRLIEPFPPRILSAQGAYITDEDGHRILDFWQGHHANILGHNPPVVTEVLAQAFASGSGLQAGFTDRVQVETAELICRQTGAERVRFTTSGALATMNAILLARAFTGRQLVIKIGGGWHGAHPWGLKGVHFNPGRRRWAVESRGIPAGLAGQIVVTRYNDPQMLRAHFLQYGQKAACLILEPFMGSGGFIPAQVEYLQAARQLCSEYGVVLIYDEVISGFRFHAGDAGSMLGVRPDLTAMAKIIGGGMPVAAVAGKAEILNLAGRAGGGVVAFQGGTYSAHPASMLASRAMLSHLVENEPGLYPRLGAMGAKLRHIIEQACAAGGLPCRCSGAFEAAPHGSSFAMPNFPADLSRPFLRPEDVHDPAACDIALPGKILQLALLLEDVHVVHGCGTVSAAHTEADLARLGEAMQKVARRILPYR